MGPDFAMILRALQGQREGQQPPEGEQQWATDQWANRLLEAYRGAPGMPPSSPNASPQLPERFTPNPGAARPSMVSTDEISARIGAEADRRMVSQPPQFARDLYQGLEHQRPKPKWYDLATAMATGAGAGYLNATNKFRKEFEGAPSSPVFAQRMGEWQQKRRAAGEGMKLEQMDQERAMQQQQLEAQARHRAEVLREQQVRSGQSVLRTAEETRRRVATEKAASDAASRAQNAEMNAEMNKRPAAQVEARQHALARMKERGITFSQDQEREYLAEGKVTAPNGSRYTVIPRSDSAIDNTTGQTMKLSGVNFQQPVNRSEQATENNKFQRTAGALWQGQAMRLGITDLSAPAATEKLVAAINAADADPRLKAEAIKQVIRIRRQPPQDPGGWLTGGGGNGKPPKTPTAVGTDPDAMFTEEENRQRQNRQRQK